MASQNLHLLSLGFTLLVLCMHHCIARKVLMEDLKKQEKAQPRADMKPASMPENGHKLGQNNNTKPNQKGEIDLESCGDGCCEGGCCEGGCCGGGCETTGYWVPTPPIVTPRAPHLVPSAPIFTPQPPHVVAVPTPPLVTPQPPHMVPTPPLITPEPPIWVPNPPPCTPCEPWHGPGPCPCPCEEGMKTESNNNAKEEGEKMHASGGDKMEDSAPSSPSTADAPMAAMMDGSNVRA